MVKAGLCHALTGLNYVFGLFSGRCPELVCIALSGRWARCGKAASLVTGRNAYLTLGLVSAPPMTAVSRARRFSFKCGFV